MSGPNFTGPAIFAGVGKGVADGLHLYMQYKHLQNEEKRADLLDKYYKFRGVTGDTKDFMDQGGHLRPITQADPAALEAEMGRQGDSLRHSLGEPDAPAEIDPQVAQAWNGGAEALGRGAPEFGVE